MTQPPDHALADLCDVAADAAEIIRTSLVVFHRRYPSNREELRLLALRLESRAAALRGCTAVRVEPRS